MQLVVNLHGWYLRGLGGLNKGRVIDLDDIENPEIKDRIKKAYESGEKGFCPKEKKILPVLIRKKTNTEVEEEAANKIISMIEDDDDFSSSDVGNLKEMFLNKIRGINESKKAANKFLEEEEDEEDEEDNLVVKNNVKVKDKAKLKKKIKTKNKNIEDTDDNIKPVKKLKKKIKKVVNLRQ